MTIGEESHPEFLNLGGGKNGVSIPTVLALDENDYTVRAWGAEVSRFYRGNNSEGVKVVSNFKRHFGATPKEDAPDEEMYADAYTRLFLEKLAESVRRFYNVATLDPEDYAACIGHPAGWDEKRIEALKQCAIWAGFPAEEGGTLYTVEEPVAAMHALRVTDDLGFKFNNAPEHYLVIDFGGGTLDVCVVKTGILGQLPTILSTAGNTKLGGKDFDDIIEGLFFRDNMLIEKRKLRKYDLYELAGKIRDAKESISLSLKAGSASSTQSINLQSGQYSLKVSKEQLDAQLEENGYKDDIMNAIRESLAKAGIEKSKIRKVILTGGSSAWWFVRELVAKEFNIHGDYIYETQEPSLDVATGCAVSKGYSSGQSADKKGVWVRVSIDKGNAGRPQLVFNPFRGVAAASKEKVYLGVLPSSKSLKPYTLHLYFQTGLDESDLSVPEEAVVEFYARSNYPTLRRVINGYDAVRGKPTQPLNDHYHIYLYASEDKLGGIKWRLQISDFSYCEREKVMLYNEGGEELAKKMPEGKSTEVDVITGKTAYRSLFGLKEWKHRSLA